MKKIFIAFLLGSVFFRAAAQETVYPAPVQKQAIALTNATIHVGNGQVLENATIFQEARSPASEQPSIPAALRSSTARGNISTLASSLLLPISVLLR
jgi:hypothetical protein